MRIRDICSLGSVACLGAFLLQLIIIVLACAASASAQTSAPPAPDVQTLKNWRNGMAHVPPPKAGCFTSSYPNTQWQEVPCKAPPKHPFLLAHGPQASTVGNGNDVAVGVTSGQISLAVGSFDSVTGVTSITSEFGSNDYSLQMNTNLFSTPACSGAAQPSQCTGWVQFLYSQDQCSGPCAFLEYSLINWGSSNCPSGWGSYQSGSEWVCYFNTNGAGPTTPPAVSDLGKLSLIAEAQPDGNDTVVFSSGSALYLVQNPDSQLDLAFGWNSVEYNIVGDCCGSAATFNSGSAMTVRVDVQNGSTSAPSCVSSTFNGYTGETNNLNFAGAPAAIRGTMPAMMFSQSSSGTTSSPCAAATAIASGALVDTHDFNADGKSDILWLNTSDGSAMWLMNGASILQSAGVGTVPSAWSIVGQRDFNGDGKADILWHDTSGDVAVWLMNGATIMQSLGIGNANPGVWSIVGTGDFDGYGYADILWRDTSGDVAIWFMNGNTIVQSCGIGTAPTNWSIAGTGDFNGDGRSDILWHDTAGDVAIWEMNGCSILQSLGVGNANPSVWSIAGTGDFNGDGRSDILWHDTSGDVAIWFMNGATITQSSGVGTANPSVWSIAQTGDYYGAGTSDILWRDTSGDVAVWQMNGATITQSTGIGTAPPVWSIQGAGAD